ncbi:hypothetical protein HHI36_021434 [Cryptolaemus montrouzieri]|uniref:Metalloendopeptidase n=1 Tax=Cryptolaemus montrouzieri TaxID=559131 RepID=A0ABD2MWR9_9CUCU
MIIFVCFAFIFCAISCWPVVEDINDNEIETEVGMTRFGKNIFRLPDEESGRNVASWNENSKVNPEELGNYFEGDIRMHERTGKNGLKDETYRWSNGVIPYEISGHFSSSSLDVIKRAMGVYHKYTCIRFVPRTSSHKDYVSITSGNTGCWSSVGRITGRQEVNLQSPACTTKLGTVLHELMHVAGFYHEQNRPERDDYVTVNFHNIKPGHDANFIKADKDKTISYGVPYDYRSVMHYSDHAFSRNGQPTIVPKQPEAAKKMGQREGFSRGDILKLNAMYNCPDSLPEFTTVSSGNGSGGHNGGQDILSALFSLFEE